MKRRLVMTIKIYDDGETLHSKVDVNFVGKILGMGEVCFRIFSAARATLYLFAGSTGNPDSVRDCEPFDEACRVHLLGPPDDKVSGNMLTQAVGKPSREL